MYVVRRPPIWFIILIFISFSYLYLHKNKVLQQTSSLSSTPTESHDCRTWEKIEYKPVVASSDKFEFSDDEDKPEDRLKSWDTYGKYNEEKKFPISGTGSRIENCLNFMAGLKQAIDRIKIELNKDVITVLDSSCGDMTWMPTFLEGRTDVEYTGYDLQVKNVENARTRFANKTWKFDTIDLVKNRIEDRFDLIINRHTAIHLGLKDNIQMFYNFIQSKGLYLMTTTFPKYSKNRVIDPNAPIDPKIKGFRFHWVNLVLPPFYFPPPLCLAPDVGPDMGYALWKIGDITELEQNNKESIKPFVPK